MACNTSPSAHQSLLLPEFLATLADSRIRTVMLCGCGGGFDFVHSLVLYPELRRLGKTVVIGSYSFGDPRDIHGDAEVVFDVDGVIAKRVTSASVPHPYYGPEVHVCSYLDHQYPDDAPHFVYAYYARAFTVPLLRSLYVQFLEKHAVDAIVLVDGGSDSLMVGDEEGLGDPIEDSVSVTAVASLAELKAKILLSIGFGCDRFNHVSDAASLRAIAELTAQGGFLGAVAMQPTSAGFRCYRECLDHIYARQRFRSVVGGAIASASEGHYGGQNIPARLQARVDPGEIFLWPLMAVIWAFDVDKVAERSQISRWIRDKTSVRECYDAVFDARQALEAGTRAVEDLPRHEEMRGAHPNLWQQDEWLT
jgi:hypothetical protein